MSPAEALNVLRLVRDGRDPLSREPLPFDHPMQRAELVRALFLAVAVLEREAAPANDSAAAGELPGEPAPAGSSAKPPRARPANAGLPWSDDDDRRLVEAFDGGADLKELGAAFGRSKASIRARLMRLGRGALLPDGPPPRYPVATPLDDAVTI